MDAGPDDASVVGVGPHPEPWPTGDRFDPELLAAGDRRNVADRYRYWKVEAIAADLASTKHSFEVAIENLGHDFNIGSIVRTANAFGAGGVHIVGRRRWNRRGAMVTDRYLSIRHHVAVTDLIDYARSAGLAVIAVDIVPGSVPIEAFELPERCILLFGEEGPGLSPEALSGCDAVVSISQFGSTRSINAGAAAAVAMHAWIRQHVFQQKP